MEPRKSYKKRKMIRAIMQTAKLGSSDIEINQSIEFVNRAFDKDYDRLDGEINFVFLVPTRASATDEFWDEVYFFIPSLAYIGIEDRLNLLYDIPPAIIDYYINDTGKVTGAVVYSSILPELLRRNNSHIIQALKIKRRIRDAIAFSSDYLGAKYIGLGGVLPKLTRHGLSIRGEFYATTGHAGTTWLLMEMLKEALWEVSKRKKNPIIGIIGGGAIGRGVLSEIVLSYPMLKVVIYDIRGEVNLLNHKMVRDYGSDAIVASNNHELIRKSDIVISAITGKVSVVGINLCGKIIIDDSQPPSFEKRTVEQSGGDLRWVVGGSDQFPYRKMNELKFGNKGLASHRELWGCEAEVSILSHFNLMELSVVGELESKHVANLDPYFKKLGFGPAKQQSFGQYKDAPQN